MCPPIPRSRFFHVRESRILPDMSYYTPENQYAAARREMVDRQIRARGIVDPRVLAAMTEVPRHRFLPWSLWPSAYWDTPLPIGENQTISQPYIIALMTEALELAGRERILEIGTGVGYQTAILAELGGQVFTIERLPTLACAARSCLRELGYGNVETLLGDGTLGLPDQAPFDRILATGCVPRIPPVFKEQLRNGGILVLPVGGRREQDLLRVRRMGHRFDEERLIPCQFVPLLGQYGWDEPTR